MGERNGKAPRERDKKKRARELQCERHAKGAQCVMSRRPPALPYLGSGR